MGFFRKLFRKDSRTDAVVYSDGIEGAVYPKNDFEQIAKDAYMENLTAFRAITIVAKGCASVPWKQYRTGAEDTPEEVEQGPVYDLLYRPNPGEGWASLLESLVSFFLLNGNAYLERVALKTGDAAGTPKELYSLRPDKMKIMKGLRSVLGYRYGDGQRTATWKIDPKTGQSDILHFKTFNPLDDFYGHPATMSAAGLIDNSNDALSWNRGMMKNGARPGTVVTMERSLSPDQYLRFKEDLRNNYGGPSNAGKLLLFDDLGEGKINIQPFGWSPKELDFTETSRENARQICQAYGVPHTLVVPGESTYNNLQEARAIMWEDTIVPLLCYLRDELNNWLYPLGSEMWIDFDLNNVPALEVRREAKWKRVQDSDFLTINEKREAHGYEGIDGGDTIYMPMSMTPMLGEVPDEEPAPQVDQPLTEDVVDAEEEQARNRLLETGIPQEMLDAYVGLTEEFGNE